MRLHASAACMALVVVCHFSTAPSYGQCSVNNGPDVIVGDLSDVTLWGRVMVNGEGVSGYSVGTVSCNIGNVTVNWQSGNSEHPVIAQNMYRLKNGRFEQIGLSWLKHGFTALAGQVCCTTCQNPGTGTLLGIGCSDPYGAGLNGDQTRLGPRSEVNAATGVYPYPYIIAWQQQGDNIFKRIQVKDTDVRPSQNVGAQYFVEGQYVTHDDATANNKNNNASYRRMTITESSTNVFTPALTGSTVRQRCAIQAWSDVDPQVTLVSVDVPGDGRIWVGYKVTNPSPGVWHYEYAVQNQTSDRAVGAISIPVLGASLSNIGYHDVKYHSGEPYATTDWTVASPGGSVSWACQPYAQNQNANALRWGTLYNFRFDATTQPLPQTANMTIGLFKPGTPASVTAAVAVPAPADCNTNGVQDNIDISNGTSADCNSNGVPDECEMATNDCNHNGLPDDCEGTDCNTNNIRDFCELTGQDCNGDGVLDMCQLTGHDCNTNLIYDSCEITTGNDCNSNGVPDQCEPDCNRDGVIDACAGQPDCNMNGIPDNCDIAPHPATLNYSSGTVNLPIPDHSTTGVSSILAGTQAGTVTDVNVRVQIQHPNLQELLIGITHGSTTVTLWNGRCAGTSNLNITFDDQGTAVLNCSALFGTIRPSVSGGGSLGAFNSSNAIGNWTLKVIDLTTGLTGTLVSWSLEVAISNYPAVSQDANSNGIPDECECTCRGDMNHDGTLDGADIQGFVTRFLSGTYEMCADINRSGTLNGEDLSAFSAAMLAGSCP